MQKKKNRCFHCKVKISSAMQLTNKCQCGYIFCHKHRHADDHDCDFDHEKRGKAILGKTVKGTSAAVGRSVHRMDSADGADWGDS